MMADLASMLWVVMLAAWIGALIGQRAERKLHNVSHETFVQEAIEAAKGLKQTRIFVGDGPRIVHECKWRIHGVGEFDVMIAESLATGDTNVRDSIV